MVNNDHIIIFTEVALVRAINIIIGQLKNIPGGFNSEVQRS